MPFPNFHAFRMINPERFEQNSFRNKEITPGIETIMGKLKGKDSMTIQAYRFDKKKWDFEKAKKWMTDHKLKYIEDVPASNKSSKESLKMDKYQRNALAAKWIWSLIIEQDSQITNWANVNRSRFPKECFLWIEDPVKKSTWYLPYREGAGTIDLKTGMYKSAGGININALRAISEAINGSKTGTPMNIPSEIKSKIQKLLKENNIESVKTTKESFGIWPGMNCDDILNQIKHRLIDIPDFLDAATEELDKTESLPGNVGDKVKAITMACNDLIMALIDDEGEESTEEGLKSQANTNLKESVHDGSINVRESSIEVITKEMYDETSGLIKGMAILRPTSKNCNYKEGLGRRYSDQALSETASMINGRKAYLNHQSISEAKDNYGVRKLEDLLGTYQNGRVDENKIVRADFKILQTKNVKEFVNAIIELEAPGVGASIVGGGRSSFNKDSKMEIIESMISLNSADWVSETGSTLNLFESDHKVEPNGKEKIKESKTKKEENMDYSQLTLVDLKQMRPDIFESIRVDLEEQYEDDRKETEKAKTIISENEALNKENAKLKKENDEHHVKESIAQRKEEVATELKESKLDPKHVTDTFREILEAVDSADARKKIIEDRQKLITESKGKEGVKGMGKEQHIEESDAKKTDEELYQESCHAIGVVGKK
jgi:hypothetical protein